MEQRLIDANAIKLEKGFFEKVDNVPKFYEWLGKQPTVDAVQVVRCGKCEYHGEPHRTDMGVDVVWCNFYNTHKLKDGYCNCGEREGGEYEL